MGLAQLALGESQIRNVMLYEPLRGFLLVSSSFPWKLMVVGTAAMSVEANTTMADNNQNFRENVVPAEACPSGRRAGIHTFLFCFCFIFVCPPVLSQSEQFAQGEFLKGLIDSQFEQRANILRWCVVGWLDR